MGSDRGEQEVDAVVWVADDCVYEGLNYGARLAEQLTARGLRVTSKDLTRIDDLRPPDAALHVISGGGTSVNDQSGWMPAGLELVRSLVDDAKQGRHAVLGVCLGSQMIAETVCRGSIRAGAGIEVGLTEVAWYAKQPAGNGRLIVPAFHYEAVDRSRVADQPGLEILAEDTRGGLQGFRLGDRVVGVQFHPELKPEDVRRLVNHHRLTIEKHRNSTAAALRSVDILETNWDSKVFDHVLAQVDVFRNA